MKFFILKFYMTYKKETNRYINSRSLKKNTINLPTYIISLKKGIYIFDLKIEIGFYLKNTQSEIIFF